MRVCTTDFSEEERERRHTDDEVGCDVHEDCCRSCADPRARATDPRMDQLGPGYRGTFPGRLAWIPMTPYL